MIIQSLALIALVCAAPARADVSDSGNLTIGGQGIIQGTMTVQGAQFSVGGTTFSVAGGSVTLGGVLNAAAAGIKWADGSTSTSSSSGGGSGNVVLSATQTFTGTNTFAGPISISSIATVLVLSSATYVPSANFTATAFGVCYATVTIEGMGANRAIVFFNGALLNSTLGNTSCVTYLIDGAFPSDTGTKSLECSSNAYNNYYANLPFHMPTPVLSAGTHKFCITAKTNGNTGQIGSSGTDQVFGAYELH